MSKEQNCTNYDPGYVEYISGDDISSILLRDGRKSKKINGLMLGGIGDNQRRTMYYYIYADDNLLGGK